MNTVALIGRLTRDPELRHTASGTTVCSFGLAVDRAGDSDGNGGYDAGFFDVNFFGKTAETVAQYLVKGRQVGVEGSLRFHRWDAEDGSKRSKVEVVGRSFTFCGSKTDGDSNGGASQSSFVPAAGSAVDDDIPF